MRLTIPNKSNNENYPAKIHRLLSSDIDGLDSEDWTFDWGKEAIDLNYQTYKLVLSGYSQIQGLLSFEEIDDGEGYILIRYLESALHNRGKNGEFRIAPALLAYTCKRSFDKGYDGFVCVQIKIDKKLMDFYESLGAIYIGNKRMIFDTFASNNLIQLYLNKGGR